MGLILQDRSVIVLTFPLCIFESYKPSTREMVRLLLSSKCYGMDKDETKRNTPQNRLKKHSGRLPETQGNSGARLFLDLYLSMGEVNFILHGRIRNARALFCYVLFCLVNNLPTS
jgi:hypothetical protein